jgi:hypothetical protein
VKKLDTVVPQGGANLERAFSAVRSLSRLPDSVILLTDGLPTRSDTVPMEGEVDESTRVRFFEIAVKQLPSRIPVSTILFPLLTGDPAAPGLFWSWPMPRGAPWLARPNPGPTHDPPSSNQRLQLGLPRLHLLRFRSDHPHFRFEHRLKAEGRTADVARGAARARGTVGRTANVEASREDLDRANARVATLVTDARLRNDSIHALLDDLEGALQKEKKGQEALLVDIDELKKEIAARQKKPDLNLLPEVKPAPLGLPVGSNYIAFVIDTSGSMRDPHNGGLWPIAIRTIEQVLDVYPKIEGIQSLDADGRFILGRRGDRLDAG